MRRAAAFLASAIAGEVLFYWLAWDEVFTLGAIDAILLGAPALAVVGLLKQSRAAGYWGMLVSLSLTAFFIFLAAAAYPPLLVLPALFGTAFYLLVAEWARNKFVPTVEDNGTRSELRPA